MNFVTPAFLYGLFFLAIPILIHLFNFRRYKTVYFSQVRFLKNVKKQTQSTSNLKHLIVLLLRCLALASIVVAFAQPYFKTDSQTVRTGKKGVIVYLDNSFSMQANDESGSLLNLAKNKAYSIANAYSASDKFQLITNNFDGSELRWLNKEAYISKVQAVDFSPIYRNFNQVLQRITTSKNDEKLFLERYIISDLQQINFKNLNQNTLLDSSFINFIPTQNEIAENAWLTNLQSFQPYHLPDLNENFTLQIKQNTIEPTKSYKGKLLLNNTLKAPFVTALEGDSINESLIFKNPDVSVLNGEVIIKDYPVTFDDTLYFSYPLKQKINVVQLHQGIPSVSVSNLFLNDSLIQFNQISVHQIDLEKIATANFIILENISELSSGISNALADFIKNGGNLVVFPADEINGLNSFLNNFGLFYTKQKTDSLKISSIDENAAIFNGVFEEKPKNLNLPNSYINHQFNSLNAIVNENILGLQNGNSFLKKYTTQGGSIYMCASGLNSNQSNFTKHALFVPVLFNMALQSVNESPLFYYLGTPSIQLKNIKQQESPLKIVADNFEIIPKQAYNNNTVNLFLNNQIKNSGHYKVVQGEEVITTLSFNYDRNESVLATYDKEDFLDLMNAKNYSVKWINSNAETLANEIENTAGGKNLWKYFIALALLFLGLEILFLRILKG